MMATQSWLDAHRTAGGGLAEKVLADVLKRDLPGVEVIPFDNAIAILDLTGEQLDRLRFARH